MDTCAAEVGLLKKHPCGQHAVAHCANCEMALCTKHAVPQLNPNKQRTGKFMCAECDRANKAADKGMAAAPHHAPPKPATPAAHAPAAKPAARAPAAAPAPKPSAPAHAGAAPKPAAPAAKEEKFKLEETGPIEFTPEKKK